jgi:lipopolysaccharide transport system ATP-binding protein
MSFVRAHDLGKAYKRYDAKWGRLSEWLGGPPRHVLHWVLRDVSFDIAPGEAVGIIGPNGAGKSTLLKIIAGTLRPTAGTCEAEGHVAALLELGLGFHPEFTGRQNVGMAGHLQGIRTVDMEDLMASVAEFAEIGEYFDQPVRIYSTGMQVRLAFAIATAVRPDVLIVDEALSVGDIYFQQKCYDRIRGFRDAGTTLLFVSHSLGTVYSLCSRVLYIEKGRLELDGSPREAIDLYQARAIAQGQKHAMQIAVVVPDGDSAAAPAPAIGQADGAHVAADESGPSSSTPSASPVQHAENDVAVLEAEAPAPSAAATGSYFSEGVAIESVTLRNESGRMAETFLSSENVVVDVVGTFARALPDPHFGFQVRDRLGQALFMTTTHGLGRHIGPVEPGDVRRVRFRFQPSIAPGQYTVTAGIANSGRFDGTFEQSLVRHQDVAAFTVIDSIDSIKWAGMINLNPTVEIVRDR